MEISEQDFDTAEEFFEYCSQKTGEEINSYTLNRKYKSKWCNKTATTTITINNQFDITFDSGGYNLIEK